LRLGVAPDAFAARRLLARLTFARGLVIFHEYRRGEKMSPESAPRYGKVSRNPTLFHKPEINWSRAIPRKEDGTGGWGRTWQRGKNGKRISAVKGGFIAQYRADKYALDPRVTPLCKSLVEHVLGETESSPQKSEWCHDTTPYLADLFHKSERAIEMGIAEASKLCIFEREYPDLRYNKKTSVWRTSGGSAR